MSKANGNGNGARPERPGDAVLELAAEIARDEEWDDWEESTVRTVIVEDRRQPSKPDGMAAVAHAAVNKLPPSHLLIVVLVVALAGAAVGGHRLGWW